MRPNTLLKKIKAGQPILGTWSMTCSRAVVEAMGYAGLDFVIIDMEHGVMSMETAEDLVRAAQVSGCQPIIRLGNADESLILKALETGCGALMIPHVSTPAQAQKIVQACKYAPEGTRGLSPYTRPHEFDHANIQKSMAENNKDTFVGVLVEGEAGIKNLESIAQVPGLDMIYTGIFDISQVMGVPGQLDHPKVMDTQKKCVAACKSNNVMPGTFARDENCLKETKEMGYQFIAYSCDSHVLKKSYKAIADAF